MESQPEALSAVTALDVVGMRTLRDLRAPMRATSVTRRLAGPHGRAAQADPALVDMTQAGVLG
jgi:hypothetical protein